jgi:hypothetical protein
MPWITVQRSTHPNECLDRFFIACPKGFREPPTSVRQNPANVPDGKVVLAPNSWA